MGGAVLDHFLFRFLISRFVQNLKLSTIASNFGRFLPSQILGVLAAPKTFYPNYHACHAARHVEKFREVTLFSLKVIGVHMLNFKQIFECSLLKIVGGPPSPVGCALARVG